MESDKGGPPAQPLSREEVMAQRAAKKKEKEARKNKGGGGDEAVKKQEVTPKPSEKKEGGAPGEELSREEVMAQRAAKKKEKEARKNKSGGGGDGGGKPPGSEEKPQQQKKQQVPKLPGSEEKPQQEKKRQAPQPPQKVPSEAKPTPGTKPAPVKIETTSSAPPAKASTPAKDPTPPKEKPDKKSNEYESTLQSLFNLKLEPIKDSVQIHPDFRTLGVKLKNNIIQGANYRCIALLNVIKSFIHDFEVPAGMNLKHSLSAELKNNLKLLQRISPFAIAMTNAVEYFNGHLFKLEEENQDITSLKAELMDLIEQYIEEKIEKAVEAIVFYGIDHKIMENGPVMIYSVTEALLSLIEKSAEDGMSFELIVIHTPETINDLNILLERLSGPIKKQSVRISTVNFSSAISRIKHCSKLVIGGHGLFTTGGVMAQSGSGQLALLANTFNKPAIFLCETYKFCDRSPLDFFAMDEYLPEKATGDELFEPKIKYDITPANLVTVVITDIDLLPSVSVPVVLRVQEVRVTKKLEGY